MATNTKHQEAAPWAAPIIDPKLAALMPELVPRKTDFGSLTVFIYGAPKIGKSTFASAFPNAIFLPTEPGLNNLSVRQIPPDGSGVQSWEQFSQIVQLLRSDAIPPSTVVIDTADNLYKLASSYVCRKRNVEHPEDIGKHGKGFGLVSSQYESALRMLIQSKHGVVMISHAKEIEADVGGVKRNRWTTTMPGAAAKVSLGLADMILFFQVQSIAAPEGGHVMRRFIRTKPSIHYEAGDKTGTLPETIDLSFDAFAAAYAAGRALIEAGGEGAPVVHEDSREGGGERSIGAGEDTGGEDTGGDSE